MLTGDESITGGDAFVRGFSLKNQSNKVHRLVSYCPQFDALLTDLTARETLLIFSLIRGIPKSEIDTIYTNLSSELGLWRHLDKQVNALSGGNKRKLSTAVALLGDPDLIFLDEPTTGC
jgi:ATP-binding cassette, subfamily A (ABC1), member 3